MHSRTHQLRVIPPILAVRLVCDGAHSKFVRVSTGTIVTTSDDLHEPGLVGVRALQRGLTSVLTHFWEVCDQPVSDHVYP
jgi:hypothetical protein